MTTFRAVGIPVNNNSLHQFTCDWESLSLNGEGVMVCIDSDDDNLFEEVSNSDSELTVKEFMFPAKAIFTFNAFWEGVNYPVIMFSSNSSITDFNFNQPQKQIRFELSGETGSSGYCNITIPKNLLKGEPWALKLNGTSCNFQSTSNETHSFIYFTCTFASTLEVVIQGTWVIPEFPSAAIVPLFMILTMFAVVFAKKKQKN